MRHVSLLGVLMLAWVLVGCGEGESTEPAVYESASPAASQSEESAATVEDAAASLITAAADDADTVNSSCPVSGRDIAAEGSRLTYEGKVYGFCCGNCIERFKEDPASFALAE